jgi:hypothetical protein
MTYLARRKAIGAANLGWPVASSGMKGVAVLAAFGLLALAPGATTSAPAAVWMKGSDLSPDSGPPGTVVTVSPDPCEAGGIAQLGTERVSYSSEPFSFTIPDLPEGQHWISLTCMDPGFSPIRFTRGFLVTTSTVVAQPSLTG